MQLSENGPEAGLTKGLLNPAAGGKEWAIDFFL